MTAPSTPNIIAQTEGLVSRAQFKWAQDIFSRLNNGTGKVSHTDLQRAGDILRDYTAEQAKKLAPQGPTATEPEENGPQAKRFGHTIVDACITLGIHQSTWKRWAKIPSFPAARSDGRWPLDEIRAWAKSNGKLAGDTFFEKESAEEEAERGKLELRRLRTICDRLDFEFSVRQDEFVTKVEHESTCARIAANVRRVLLPLPAGLSPQVVGLSIADAEETIRKAVFEALEELHAGQWEDEDEDDEEDDPPPEPVPAAPMPEPVASKKKKSKAKKK
jgi:hypothetical protein